ncbi:hypothetical protein HGRIS_002615 [Hohenbuehelia grisea]|uniref:RRM domain-containing protein n=1 Tax=Hohenbuehelia grisea TaxID=104357 RepID=A0ABR3JLJ1_9AGAR
MTSFNSVVKVVAGNAIECDDVRRIFSNLGEILAIHSTSSQDKTKTNVFIQFATDNNAERAVAFQNLMPHIRVSRIADDPALIHEFQSIEVVAGTDRQSQPAVNISSEEVARPPKPSDLETPARPQADRALHLESPLSSLGSCELAAAAFPTPTSLPSSTPSLGASLRLGVPVRDPQPLAYTLDSKLSFVFQGDAFNWDLDSGVDDPRVVIELLERTSSPVGNWMTCAASFRRKANPQAAHDIVNAMVDFMSRLRVPQMDLKPAFLMLSGCETDLARLAKANGEGAGVISLHYERSKEYLQKVYGLNVPQTTELPPSNALRLHFPSCQDPAAPLSSSTEYNKQPLGPDQVSLQLGRDSLASQHDTSTAHAAHSSHQPPLSPDAQFRSNAASRSSKRRLEDDYEYERGQRRKLERQLENMTHERDCARRAEDQALLKIRREVQARRKAEDEAAQEREMRKDSEKRAAVPVFENLAHIFQLAAQGDKGALMAGALSNPHR